MSGFFQTARSWLRHNFQLRSSNFKAGVVLAVAAGACFASVLPAASSTAVAESQIDTAGQMSGKNKAGATRQWSKAAPSPYRLVVCGGPEFCVSRNYSSSLVSVYNGRTWGAPQDAGVNLNSLTCEPTFCIGTWGGFSTPGPGGVVKFKDGNWLAPQQVGSGGVGSTDEGSCASEAFCVFTADYARWIFDGDNATASFDSRDYGLGSPTCASISFCMVSSFSSRARGENLAKSYIRTFDGTSWSDNYLLAKGGSLSVSCPSQSFCVVGDTAGRFFTFNGSTWTNGKYVSSRRAPIDGVSCSSRKYCVASGSEGLGLWEYRAKKWTTVTEVKPSNVLNAASCATGVDQFCVLPSKKPSRPSLVHRRPAR